jgi:hypothetical protein
MSSGLLAAEDASASMQKPSMKQWLVLVSFCLNTALNSFLSVNFAVLEDAAETTFNIDEQGNLLFYTLFLLTVAVGMFPGLMMATRCEGLGLGLSVAFNVSCTWVRWIGVKSRSYNICIASAILNAAGAWVILPLPAQLSQQRFPPEWWTFTTSIAIQANYSGWLLGSLLPPALVDCPEKGCPNGPEDMERFMLYQAFASIPVVLGFLLFYRPTRVGERLAGEESRFNMGSSFLSERGEAPPDDLDREAGTSRAGSSYVEGVNSAANPSVSPHGHGAGSAQQFIRTLRRYPRFGMQVLAYGILGGVSFAFPGCDEALLKPHGFHSKQTANVNMAFLACGIISGLVLGAKVSVRRYGIVLKALFIICLLASAVTSILFNTGVIPNVDPHEVVDTRYLIITMVLFGLTGATSLGFIGLGIEAAALYPAGGAYVCFTIEGLVQVVGALLNQFAPLAKDFSFVILTICVLLSTLLVVIGYKPYKPQESATAVHRNHSPDLYGGGTLTRAGGGATSLPDRKEALVALARGSHEKEGEREAGAAPMPNPAG